MSGCPFKFIISGIIVGVLMKFITDMWVYITEFFDMRRKSRKQEGMDDKNISGSFQTLDNENELVNKS